MDKTGMGQRWYPSGGRATNAELRNILEEETAPFFKGQKAAKETAEIIQNRVQIYMKEHS